MPAAKTALLRRVVAAAALLAALALAGCDGGRIRPHLSTDDGSSAFSGWGSGWGGNRDWGEGAGH
jgi:hypothetical protein